MTYFYSRNLLFPSFSLLLSLLIHSNLLILTLLIWILRNKGEGNNSLLVGQYIKLGTYPNRKSAEIKRRELHQEYKSANQHEVLSRKSWDPKLDIVIKPSSLV